MKLSYSIKEGLTKPVRATSGSAGIDIFAMPWLDGIKLFPQVGIKIPTGIHLNIPDGYYVEVKNRSSVASKSSVIVGACVIDSDYQGEVFINLINVSDEIFVFDVKKAIAQLILHKCYDVELLEVEHSALYEKKTDRGALGFGSTDKD